MMYLHNVTNKPVMLKSDFVSIYRKTDGSVQWPNAWAANLLGPSLIRIGLVGAGNIARVHAAVLTELGLGQVKFVVDPVAGRGDEIARLFPAAQSFKCIEDALAAVEIDIAHVLVPPALHCAAAAPLLRAGIGVLVEKPMAATVAECEELISAAQEKRAPLRVNHNFVHHPAQRSARIRVAQNRLGRIRHVAMLYSMPLRQLAAHQLSHWMFAEPVNLLLEQAVHPLSQLEDFIGPAAEVVALRSPPTRLDDGLEIRRTWHVALRGAEATGSLHFSVGESLPIWRATVIGDDGTIDIDYHANHIAVSEPTRWPDFADALVTGLAAARTRRRQALVNFVRYLGSTAKFLPRSDPFYRSMKASIADFYSAIFDDGHELDGAAGLRTVRLCFDVARPFATTAERLRAPSPARSGSPDVAVLGGTGFIGRALVKRLVASGRRVAVLARNTDNLPAVFADAKVSVVPGSIGVAEDVVRAVDRAPQVVNLAHGGGGEDAAAVERAMVGGAATVAQAVHRLGVGQLVHVGSIAALYLGDAAATITGRTPVDPRYEERADYSRAKALADLRLLALHRECGLPVTILRPGLVIGEGASPFHSGVGFLNRETHVLGWNAGTNPLPFVLVEDVAAAIAAALERDDLAGLAFNLVGDVRPSAREYVKELGAALGRPIRYYPQSVERLFAIDIGKWMVKRAIGRRSRFPSYRDLRSRGLLARFDCTDAKERLGWSPVSERAVFIAQGIAIHGRA
jgi:predicted dehydrogenase/nucleoside-diphosphate-sugar epimerase